MPKLAYSAGPIWHRPDASLGRCGDTRARAGGIAFLIHRRGTTRLTRTPDVAAPIPDASSRTAQQLTVSIVQHSTPGRRAHKLSAPICCASGIGLIAHRPCRFSCTRAILGQRERRHSKQAHSEHACETGSHHDLPLDSSRKTDAGLAFAKTPRTPGTHLVAINSRPATTELQIPGKPGWGSPACGPGARTGRADLIHTT